MSRNAKTAIETGTLTAGALERIAARLGVATDLTPVESLTLDYVQNELRRRS